MKLEKKKVYAILSEKELNNVKQALEQKYWKEYTQLPDYVKRDLFPNDAVIDNIVFYAKNYLKWYTKSDDLCYIVSFPDKTLYIIDLVAEWDKNDVFVKKVS